MATTKLYHAFGLKGICYTSTHYKADAVILRTEMTDILIQCPKCGCREATMKGQKIRWVLHEPHWVQEIYLGA